jgi:hypothetical protein
MTVNPGRADLPGGGPPPLRLVGGAPAGDMPATVGAGAAGIEGPTHPSRRGHPETGSAPPHARRPGPTVPDRAPEPAPAWLEDRDPLLDSINVI